MKRQILVLSENTEGGESIAIERLLKAFKRKNPSVLYWFLKLENRKNSKRRFSFVRNLIEYFYHARLTIKVFIENKEIDYILASDYLWTLAAISVKPHGVKLIYLFHGLRSIPFKKISDVDYRQVVIKILERLSWMLSDSVVVPTKEAASYICRDIKFLINTDRIFIVPNIVPKVFFVSRIKRLRPKFFNIIYSGRLAKYKGLENLITAFSNLVLKIPQTNLFIAYPVSSADATVEEKIRCLVREYGIKNNVKFMKDLTEIELAKLYEKSDILVLPSEIEFAPLSVLESLAAGTPVVATDVGNIKSLLNKIDLNLILNNNSPEEIFQKLFMFFKYDKFKKEVLRKKAKRVALNFSEDDASEKFRKVLNF